ncbi:MAG TPA: hypothetical protein P5299_00765 [Candidatus Woesebacteria bacterium]|nr:hypothetical protein [Candidatus Woesebacteria bacterium]
MKASSKISKYFLTVAVLILIIVCLAIYSISLNKYLKPINEAKENELIKPFDPQLDMDTIKEIMSREDLSD